MVIALMVGWKWIFRIPLIIFWIIAICLSLTPWGFLTQLCTEHVTTSIGLIFFTLYFLVYPLVSPFFPKIKSAGGEVMERSTKILVLLVLICIAVMVVAIVAPGSVTEFGETSILAPVISGWNGLVNAVDAQRASFMLAGGLIGGLAIALIIKKVDIPKKLRMVTGKPNPTPVYNQVPAYVPPTSVASAPVYTTPTQPVQAPVYKAEEEV